MSFVDHPNLAFTVLDRYHFESIDRYRPTNEYADIARAALPADWRIAPRGYWTSCDPPDAHVAVHGWKIHVSSTLDAAIETLRAVAGICGDLSLPFKFCSDENMLDLSFNKNASRSQVGKFMTLYPTDLAMFKAAAERIHDATRHLSGPYVLTDRPYRDSRVVFYRYGEHTGEIRLDRFGHHLSGFRLADGTWYADSREPRFRLPPGIEDPFADAGELAAPSAKGVVLNNRYRLLGALKFSAVGGVYRGVDEETGLNIVAREVRNTLGLLSRERNPADALEKEARILKRLQHTGYTPVFVDLFREWEHAFLIQEQFDAQSLWSHAMGYYFAREGQTRNEALREIRSIVRKIAVGLECIHANGVILRDLTRTNVMITPSGDIKFIDYEYAHELDDDGPWVHGWTPGYAAPDQLSNARPTPADDHYAFGVLIMDILTFSASGFDLNRNGLYEKLKQNLQDLQLPMTLYDIVEGLTERDVTARWDLRHVFEALDTLQESEADGPLFPLETRPQDAPAPSENLRKRLGDLADGIVENLIRTADFERKDRIWPCSADMYACNPIGIQHGAAGPAFFLQQRLGQVDSRILDWIDATSKTRLCPPGLYSGLSGVALLFLAAGRRERAAELLESTRESPLVREAHGLYFGASGWGLACLHAWRETREDRYLDWATDIGAWLLRTGQRSDRGLSWMVDGRTPLGLGEGQSGVALFLTYLSLATREAKYSDAAAEAMDFDLSYGIDSAGKLLWQHNTQAKPGDPKSPHTWYGAAGVGTAAIRCHAATGEVRFKRGAEACVLGVSSRFTNKLWQFEGIAGFGEFMLDMARFTGEEHYARLAYYQAEALFPHAIARPDAGIAFAGFDHYRLCTDYSEGSSGIGAFVDRLLRGKDRFLMLDDWLTKNTESLPRIARIEQGETA